MPGYIQFTVPRGGLKLQPDCGTVWNRWHHFFYENFVRQIAGGNLAGGESLQADVERENCRIAQQKRVASLTKKLRSERQFNRQVESNRELRELKAELAALDV